VSRDAVKWRRLVRETVQRNCLPAAHLFHDGTHLACGLCRALVSASGAVRHA
jgi:hypothetical protein